MMQRGHLNGYHPVDFFEFIFMIFYFVLILMRFCLNELFTIVAELSVFGASMSGACTGFLLHNRYRASIVMGRVGSFALGGALATIAACSGMFIPMLIACSVFFLELLVVILQV